MISRPYIGCVVVTLALTAVRAHAQGSPWNGFEVIEENDSLLYSGRRDSSTGAPAGTDEFYTQGLRLVFTRAVDDTWTWARHLCGWVSKTTCEGRDPPYRAASSLVFGHNMLTPRVITTFHHDPNDRPYAAYAYAAARADAIRRDGMVLQFFEAQAGFLGPPALGKPIQKGFHVLREHRLPKGWDHELGTEPAVNLLYGYERRHVIWEARKLLPALEVVPLLSATLGTVQTYAAARATVRLGWNITGMPPDPNVITVQTLLLPPEEQQPPSREISVFLGIDRRVFLRNAYFDGNLVGGQPKVDKDAVVGDLRVGVSGRLGRWRASYTLVRRSREFHPLPAGSRSHHYFGSLSVRREEDPSQPAGRPLLGRDWLFEPGLGVGTMRTIPAGRRGRTTNGPSGRLALAKAIRKRVMLGIEMVGVATEDGPPDENDEHSDTFLIAKAVALHWLPFGRSVGPGTLKLRVGAGPALAKREFTARGEPEKDKDESAKGWAFVVGADYAYNFGSKLSLGLANTWTTLSVHGPLANRGTFLGTTLVLQWHLAPRESRPQRGPHQTNPCPDDPPKGG